MKTKKLVNCPECSGFGFTSTPVSTAYEITVCRAKTCELCHGAGVIEVPMTNADRIRAMSDEELAGFLSFNGDVEYCHAGMCKAGETCRICCLRWIQMPAEEDDHA